MILFEVDATGIAFFEFECDAPRSIDIDRIARRFEASQGMEFEVGDVHLFGRVSTISLQDGSPFGFRQSVPELAMSITENNRAFRGIIAVEDLSNAM